MHCLCLLLPRVITVTGAREVVARRHGDQVSCVFHGSGEDEGGAADVDVLVVDGQAALG